MRYNHSETTSLTNPYQYNGIDYVNEFGLGWSMATFRNLDSRIPIWTSVDPRAEEMPNYSPYVVNNNNPISYADPEGDIAWLAPLAIAALKGTAIGVAANGLNNTFNGQGFFQGAGKAAAFGALGGGLSFGIGQGAQALGGAGASGLQVAGAQAIGHGLAGGLQSSLGGGNFGSGFLSGAVSSGIGSGASGLGSGGQLFAGIGGGGLASLAGGGNFFDGARQGAITIALNHLAHALPPYEYNGKLYASKGKLYSAVLTDQAAEQFGIKDIVALAAALDGTFPSIDKRFSTPGSSKKTSYASKYGSKLLPQGMPKKLPTHINMRTGKAVYTKVLGRFIGRLAGPIGWGILAYDIGRTFYNTQTTYNSIINE